MQLDLAYLGHSTLRGDGAGRTLSLAPNLQREPVAFDAPLLQPLRFREAISALHDVVISDLRFRKRDKTAYLQWKAQQAEMSRQRRAQVIREAVAAASAPVPPELAQAYEQRRKRYWDARRKYSDHLRENDLALWRLLMPCDPIITVAEDVVFFECFSADESSYGCLTVDREAGFGRSSDYRPGTTNVDYSWKLYEHFQSMRSYRPTRFRIDPAGFEVATRGGEDYREEKIDLPQGWLRGLLQISGAMGLPMVKVPLAREAAYSILAFLKRHRSERSPRGVRFELMPDAPPRIVLEPWEQPIVSHATRYQGPPTEPIRIWGRRRLLCLARLLPLVDRFDVYLLGTGLPSFWVARMGDMRLTLGLSGWTRNDWTRASAIDLVAPPVRALPEQVEGIAALLRQRRAAKLADIVTQSRVPVAEASAALRHLAHAGQVICDLDAGLYRWRQIMPQVLGEEQIGADHPELLGARKIMADRPVKLVSREAAPSGGMILAGNVDGVELEIMLDAEQNVKRGRCVCGHYRKSSLRNGPCRHMIVLRRLLMQENQRGAWAQRMRGWMG